MANDQLELGSSGSVRKLVAGAGVTLTPPSGRGIVTVASSAVPVAEDVLHFIVNAGTLNAQTVTVPFVPAGLSVVWGSPPALLAPAGTLSVIAGSGENTPVGMTALNVAYQLTNADGTIHALWTAAKAQVPGNPIVLPGFADYVAVSNVGGDLVLSNNAGAPRITSTSGGLFFVSAGIALS